MAFSFALSMNNIKETAHAKRNVPTQLKSTVPTTHIEPMGVTLLRQTCIFKFSQATIDIQMYLRYNV